MKISFSESALEDLLKMKTYYEEQGVPNIGNEFVSSILAHVEKLSENPDMGRKVPEFNENRIRELIHPPFRIVYLRERSSISVIRVWRSERLLKL